MRYESRYLNKLVNSPSPSRGEKSLASLRGHFYNPNTLVSSRDYHLRHFTEKRCHPERIEESQAEKHKIFRYAQDDNQ